MTPATARLLTPRRLLMASVVVAIITITLKTLAWYVTDSVGLLSDAMESFVNLASAIFGLVMVTIAARPADEDHPYGHHKAEYFSSGFEGALIIAAAAGIIWAAGHRIFDPQPIEQVGWGLALSVASSGLNGLLAWVMFRAAKEHRSIALEADAKHLVTDVWTSAGVVVGIALVYFTGWLWLDPVVAIGVALNILWEGFHLMWRSSQGLMDEAVEPDVMATIQQTLDEFASSPRRDADHPLRPRHHAQGRPAPFCRHAHAHAGGLVARARGGRAHQRGAGADERRAGPARQHPAAAQRCGGALRRPEGFDMKPPRSCASCIAAPRGGLGALRAARAGTE